ncbi:glycoside hydrolase family 3 protein [Ideonella livida]|uniref:beta-glucosidase n=1 Tax=Ideonella livida TaxID=2707176 RepID=A0A7C9TJU9_9BURK|nr:glycoside hydrolase family 3 N-terminal domain-containing protein [Ideonella livida]NDY90865.1 glycoside hydrolase family 3 protein [Ideonella livida]
MTTPHPRLGAAAGAGVLGLSALALAGCLGSNSDAPLTQPTLGVRSKAVISRDGHHFRDANGNGQLDPYEDWRLSAQARVADLLARMSLQQKAGLMLIDTLNAGCAGATDGTSAANFVQTQQMRRFILRNAANATASDCSGSAGRSGFTVTPAQLAGFANAVQALAEAEPLGIPVLFKDNARNHYNNDPRFGISAAAGAFTEFPREAGMAAAALGTGDMAPVQALTEVMAAEWRAVGLRGAYAYMADLATEPRWYRVSETFTEDADLNARIMTALVQGLQGGPVSDKTAVALTMKHFPGGGPQEQGLDPHYSFGKQQVYPGGRFGEHLKPFMAAINAGVSSVMPYYGVPISVTYEGVTYDQTGFAFNKQIVTDLLRGKLGFQGYVNSDTGIINDRAWGLEGQTVPQRVAAAVNAGVDVLSGFSSNQTLTDLVGAGLLSEARITEAAGRLLTEQFKLGLFENPYVDVTQVDAVIGSAAHRAKGQLVQKQSIVLLQNSVTEGSTRRLPLATGLKVYTLGMGKTDVEAYGYTVTDGNTTTPGTRPSAAGHDVAVIRVQVTNPVSVTAAYRSKGATTGADPTYLNPRTGQVWGAEDPCVTHAAQNPTCVDDAGLIFGGAFPWEAGQLSFTTMAAAQSWKVSPSLSDIQAVMNEVGAKNTVLAIYFRQPYVLDEASGLRNAGAIVATFGVSDVALMEVLTGKFKPQGKLPFALAKTLQAVQDNQPDAPGYPAADTLYPYGFGLSY